MDYIKFIWDRIEQLYHYLNKSRECPISLIKLYKDTEKRNKIYIKQVLREPHLQCVVLKLIPIKPEGIIIVDEGFFNDSEGKQFYRYVLEIPNEYDRSINPDRPPFSIEFSVTLQTANHKKPKKYKTRCLIQ